MKNIICLIWSLILFSIGLGAQQLMPPIQNYRIYDYQAAAKNWGLTVGNDGELFVANNQGLLHFNGEEWTLHKLPNETTIRSVAHIHEKIFTGSYEEFGYWQKNALGLLEYTSLTHLIKDHEFTSEEFWQIIPHNGGILFRSFSTIYRYEDNEIEVIDVDIVVSKIAFYRNKALVAGTEGELFWLENAQLVPIDGDDLLKGKTVIDLVLIDEGLLIGTKLSGCYLFQDDGLIVWEEEINDELKLQQLNNILVLDSGKLAFGTIKNGIYFYDSQTGDLEKLNRETGLQNNTVLAMLQFNDQLWAGLDNGIDRIQMNNPITYYTDNSGVLGTVYDIAEYNGLLYLGSNTGVYYFQDNQLEFINGTQGHVWDLEILEGDLLAGHNTGTFQLANGDIADFFDFSGGYQFVKIPNRQKAYLQGTYNGFVKFWKEDSNSWKASRLRGFTTNPVEQLCFENESTIWAAHPYKGFYRIKIGDDYDNVCGIQGL